MSSRRLWYLGAALAYALVLAVVILGLLGLYRAAHCRLDEALGARLLGVGRSLAVMADSDRIFNHTLGDTTASIYLDILAADYLRLTRQTDLAEITLCDLEGRVLLSTQPQLVTGGPNTYWDLDRPAVELALTGTPAVTGLYRLQTTFQKSAHVPLTKDDPFSGSSFVVAVLTVSGNPDFFVALNQLRTGALITGGLVVLFLAVLGFLLHRISLALDRYQVGLRQQESLAAMGRMTAGIAHEIRNPLGIIRGAGQHLQGVLQQQGIEDEVAGFIPEEVDRLDAILSGYLAFGSGAPAQQEIFDLGLALRRGSRLLEKDLTEAGISLQLEVAEGLMIQGDPRRLQQVVLNLLLNARDAMPGGGRLRIRLRAEDSLAVAVVEDEGEGLGKARPEDLFAPFQTTKEKGSGLGLATSRRIVEDMQGTLQLKARPTGVGAVAEIRLPLVADQEG